MRTLRQPLQKMPIRTEVTPYIQIYPVSPIIRRLNGLIPNPINTPIHTTYGINVTFTVIIYGNNPHLQRLWALFIIVKATFINNRHTDIYS